MMEKFEKRILLTGGAGFMCALFLFKSNFLAPLPADGSNVVKHLVRKYPNYFIVNFDKLDYCASLVYFEDILSTPNYEFVKGDILHADFVSFVLKKYEITHLLHFAAQTHVDNSFGNSMTFTMTNVMGTHTLLECCKAHKGFQLFIHVSTDEVYGESAYSSKAIELTSMLLPTNPYSATKAGAEHIVLSYYKSYKFPVIITRGNNVYGPHQYPEKVIPKWICLLERGKRLPIHGTGANKRHFLYVSDVASAFDTILHKGSIGEIYNVSSDDEMSNLELAKKLLKLYGISEADGITFVEDRAFNDHRYFIDGNKLNALGWNQLVSFDEGLKRTIDWYRSNDINSVWGSYTEKEALIAHPKAALRPEVAKEY